MIGFISARFAGIIPRHRKSVLNLAWHGSTLLRPLRASLLPVFLLSIWTVLPLEAREVRVASFNVEHGVARINPQTGEFETELQAEKYAAISAVVARVDADIVGFQELYAGAEHFQGWLRLAEELGYAYWALSEVGDNTSDSLRVGYFSRFPILSEHNLKSAPDGRELGRASLRIVVDVPDAAYPLALWNMHFRSGSAPYIRFMRYVEAKRIVEDVNTYQATNPNHHEFIVLGDFNDDRTDAQLPVNSGQSYSWGVNWYSPLPDLFDDYGFVITGTHNSYQFSVATPIPYPIFPIHHFQLANGDLFHVDMHQTGEPDLLYTRWPSERILDYIFVSDSLFPDAVGEVYNSDYDGVGVGLPKAGDPPRWDVSYTSDHFAIFVDIDMEDFSPVMPGRPFESIGDPGGPFNPEYTLYTVSNTNAFEVFWTVTTDVDWLTVSADSFALPSLSSQDVEIMINEHANLLLPGVHIGSVIFSNSVTEVVTIREVNLTVLDHLVLFPDNGLHASGFTQGPFDPSSVTYVLSNKTPETITWNALPTPNWITVTPSSWTLTGHESVDVTVSINANANDLPIGLYEEEVLLYNTVSSLAHVRPVTLEVRGRLCEAVDHCELTWTTGGHVPWFYQTEVTAGGIDAAQSGPVLAHQQSWMETIVTGPAHIEFDWRVSSRTNFHVLRFHVNGENVGQISGEADWHTFMYALGEGVHTLRWEYAITGTSPVGENAGWVDRFVADYFTASPIGPTAFGGPEGGPFEPETITYTLNNGNPDAAEWSITHSASWLMMEPTDGVLLSGQSTNVILALTAEADHLEAGSYHETIHFSNAVSGRVFERTVTVLVYGDLCVAVDNCDLIWTTGGDAPWFYQTAVTFDGEDAAQSGPLPGPGMMSWMETIVTGPATLSFQWRISSRSGWDFVRFRRNGSQHASRSGEFGWLEFSHTIPSGVHTLRWEYVRSSETPLGADAAWVDQVSLSRLDILPSATFTAAGLPGGPFSPSSRVYTLTNNGVSAIHWTAPTNHPWLALDPVEGVLQPGEGTTVTATVTAAANDYPGGFHWQSVHFMDVSAGVSIQRFAQLNVMDYLIVDPISSAFYEGPPGGPFMPFTRTYALSNAAAESLHWTISTPATWLSISATHGTLAAGATAQVEIALNEQAYAFDSWAYQTVVFSNATSQRAQTQWHYVSVFGTPRVSPTTEWLADGPLGGPFTPATTTYTIMNETGATHTWHVTSTSHWWTVGQSSISVGPSSSEEVTVHLHADANLLPAGLYRGSILFSNVVTGEILYRNATLMTGMTLCEAVDACELIWTTGGNAPWFPQNEQTFDGVDAAASGDITHNQESWIETTVTGPGTLRFYWKVSSEQFYDFLEFRINGELQSGRISGEVDWQEKIYALGAGAHTLRWIYHKDFTVSAGADRGWVDQVVWIPERTAMGVPTAWYQGFGILPANGQSWDALDFVDSAANGTPNWMQYPAGLDPTDIDSVFRILAIDTDEGRVPRIKWWGGLHGPPSPYVIQATTNPATGSWETIGTSHRAAGTNTWTGDEPLNGAPIFRIVAEQD